MVIDREKMGDEPSNLVVPRHGINVSNEHGATSCTIIKLQIRLGV